MSDVRLAHSCSLRFVRLLFVASHLAHLRSAVGSTCCLSEVVERLGVASGTASRCERGLSSEGATRLALALRCANLSLALQC